MGGDIETPAIPVQDLATLFCEALTAACVEEGADLPAALGLTDRKAGPAERRARAACVLGLGEPSAVPLAVVLGWWSNPRSVSATLSRARVHGVATSPAARAVWDVTARAGVREVSFHSVQVDHVRAAAGIAPPAPPAAPKPDNRRLIEAALDKAGPPRVVAGRRAAQPPVRVLEGDPARQVPKARALGRRLRARGFSLSAIAVCAAASDHVLGTASWWRRQLGEA